MVCGLAGAPREMPNDVSTMSRWGSARTAEEAVGGENRELGGGNG